MKWFGIAFLITALGCSSDSNNTTRDTDTPKTDTGEEDVKADSDPQNRVPKLKFTEITLANSSVEATTEIVFVPETENEFLLLEKDGRVWHFALNGETTTEIGMFTVPDVFASSDCGLISATFDPEFSSNGFIYFGYCTSLQDSRISRHEFDASDYGKISSTATEIITVGDPDAPKAWHNVGSFGFEENGVMWALFGEKRIDEEAQNLENNLGTLVRIIPNRDPNGSGYTTATDNPFVGEGTLSEDIFAYGLRSPWKGSRDSKGRYWVGDVGASNFEELNVITAAGQNFAWPEWEGACEANCEGFQEPLSFWDRSSESDYALEDPDTNATDRRVAWVGPEYRAFGGTDRYDGGLTGRVLFGDFCAGWVRAAELDENDELAVDGFAGHLESMTGAAEGSDGYLYFVTYGNCRTFPYRAGRLWRAELAD